MVARIAQALVAKYGEKADAATLSVTLFDPDKVIDHSTYTKPFQYSEGIEYVVVNGKVVLEKGKHTGETPGRALRRGE